MAEVKRKIIVTRKRYKPDNIEELSIIEICRKYPPLTWETLFKEADDELELVSNNLEEMGDFFPLKRDIFKAFELCPSNKVKVVIFGQDPYHQVMYNGKPRAQGMSFSVSKDDSIPSSLCNIFKEINDDLGINNNTHGDLSCWARQGVLLLNACLTVKPCEAASHNKDLWMGFIDRVLKYIARINPKCIYVLWGAWAKHIKPMIEGKPHILESTHPSGYSARKGFFGCKHFSRINEILIEEGKEEIDWRVK